MFSCVFHAKNGNKNRQKGFCFPRRKSGENCIEGKQNGASARGYCFGGKNSYFRNTGTTINDVFFYKKDGKKDKKKKKKLTTGRRKVSSSRVGRIDGNGGRRERWGDGQKGRRLIRWLRGEYTPACRVI